MSDPVGHLWHASVDIGGTFTDLLLADASTRSFAVEKVLTTHDDPAMAVSEGLRRLLGRTEIQASNVGTIAHATTLVTNAVIERTGSQTALLITEGFRDTLVIGREHRYDMYDVRLEKPEPLVNRRRSFGIPERMLADGTVHQALDEHAVAKIATELHERGIVAAAVCLLHAYRYPAHELRVREILAEYVPDVLVTLSHEVVGEIREYERASTTVANAYVLRLVDRYLSRLEHDLAQLGHTGAFFVMLSSGALATTDTARRFPVRLIESGPAAGALAAAESARLMGQPDLLSFDMGGTTAKACIIQDGRPMITNELEVARLQRFRRGSGLPLEISSLELMEIGAGGGSMALIDSFGLLQVGPDSAGSEPGPICYGLGGATPTVTDADLILGYLDPDYFLGGQMKLDAEAARLGIDDQLARPLDLDTARAAWIVHEVVNENMANAARVHAVERGADLRQLPLFAFGGAGPVHAYRVARNLGIDLVIAPLGAGIGSAIGLLAAPMAFDYVRTSMVLLTRVDWSDVGELLSGMERDGRLLLGRSGLQHHQMSVEHAVDMRLVGQAHAVTVELGGQRPGHHGEERLRVAFEATYAGLFGRRPPDVAIEIVSWRLRVSGPRPEFPIGTDRNPATGTDAALKGSRAAYFPETDGFTATPVYDRYRLRPGMYLAGPAIVEERESTLVIGPNGNGRVDEHHNVLVEIAR